MFGFNRSRFDKRPQSPARKRSALGLEVLEGLALPSAVLPVPDAGVTDVAAEVRQQDYSAIVFVGGWGASSYQYAFSGTYVGGINVALADGSVRFLHDTVAIAHDDVVVDGKIITAENPSAAHVDYFIKLDGVDGEATDSTIAVGGYIR